MPRDPGRLHWFQYSLIPLRSFAPWLNILTSEMIEPACLKIILDSVRWPNDLLIIGWAGLVRVQFGIPVVRLALEVKVKEGETMFLQFFVVPPSFCDWSRLALFMSVRYGSPPYFILRLSCLRLCSPSANGGLSSCPVQIVQFADILHEKAIFSTLRILVQHIFLI